MRINFNKIEIHNFKSFADEVFDYSTFSGMNLICGKNNDIPGAKNGTGKTNLSNALVYCLFGDLQNPLKNENIRNKYIKSKEVRVAVSFSIDDLQYKVASGFNKNGAPYCNVYRIENVKEIDLTKSTIAETRKFIEKEVLRCDMSIFLRTIVLSSDQTYNFFTLRKSEKKDFIEKLFDISVFGDMYNAIHRNILDYDKDILASQQKLMVLNKNNDQYIQQIDQHNAQKKQKIIELKTTLKSLLKGYKALQDKKTNVNDEEVSKYENIISKIDNGVKKADILMKKLDADAQKTEIQLYNEQNNRQQKQKSVDKYSDIVSKLCNKCSKVFKDYYSITDTTEEIAEIDKICTELNKKLNEILSKKEKLQIKLTELNDKRSKADKKIESLTAENTKTIRQLDQIGQRIDWIKNSISTTETEENPYKLLFESNAKNIKDESESLSKMSNHYKYMKFAESIVSQDTLRKFIIKDLIGLLNNKIKHYLTKFGADYTVVFDADMNYDFITDGGICEYNNFSAGERQRIMLATCFAFRDFMSIRNNLSSNILILDEFIDGNIDAVAIDGVINVLKDFIRLYKQNIFIISHRKEIDNSIFNNIIQVQRTNHISKIAVLDV